MKMFVDILQELTDVDTLHESVEGTAALVQSLSDNQVKPDTTLYVINTTNYKSLS